MKRLLKKAKAPIDIIRIISRYQPAYLWWSLSQMIIDAALPMLYVYAPKLIIEKLTDKSPYQSIISVVIVYGGILLLLKVLNNFFSGKSNLAADKFTKQLRFEIGKLTMRLEIKNLEAASARELIYMANNASKLTGTLTIAQQMVSNIISICGLAIIAVRFDFIFLISIAVVLAAKTLFTYLQFSCNKKARKLYAKNDRIGNYLTGLAYFNHGAEKEIRVNNLQSWFMNKIKCYRGEMLRLQFKDFRRNALFDIIMSILVAAESFVVLIILSERYIAGSIAIADFTMYFSAVTALTSALSSLTIQVANYNEQVLNIYDYKKLIDLSEKENDGVPYNTVHIDSLEEIKIVFDNVSFVYPACDKKVLEHINLTISNREKLVIVGLNGSGKTTLVKLLCKLYHPTEGKITLNGVDIWNIPNDEYYSIIGAVFQDYNNFAFSLADNIALEESPDKDKIYNIFCELGMNDFLNKTPEGLYTCISRNFAANGIDVSGGEGQKLAFARAIYKDAPILILDEPTASLDAKAESEIYADFLEMSQNKTVIFISHRLAVSTLADNIAVFNGGKLVEYGCHRELMNMNGLYSKMFERQSRPYVESKAIF